MGVLPMKLSDRVNLHLEPGSEPIGDHAKQRYRYIARRQCTKVAVLAIQNGEERRLFEDLIKVTQNATKPSGHEEIAKAFNLKVDGIKIFGKVCIMHIIFG